ncbi:hypothetical protein [Methylobacterium platani]|uniref:Uncharacterized protein n=2 Tax=Methylobacterium platani TaxID=427683 RepID=A0A179S8Y5_9HYPH|nr:hypothetical protein [Methylobacterium platani]KMO12300.1 hypothetical protein SQ03_24675 [Methylobacterium platani JCM 14648]OAS23794.1 hypothetical protein A5481_16195 [Methylobacterium platani]
MADNTGQGDPPISLKSIGGALKKFGQAAVAAGAQTTDAISSARSPAIGTAISVQENYNPGRDQERARVRIAYILLAMLGLAVCCILAVGSYLALTCYAGRTCGEAKEAFALLGSTVGLIFTPIVGLVGSAIGFYLGSKSAGG